MTNEATKAAQAMREMAAQKAERLFNCGYIPDLSEEDITARDTGNQIAVAIRALPLPASSLTIPPEAITEPGPDLEQPLREANDLAAHFAARAAGCDEALRIAREATRYVVEQFENQDLGHAEFRVQAAIWCRSALSAIEAALGEPKP